MFQISKPPSNLSNEWGLVLRETAETVEMMTQLFTANTTMGPHLAKLLNTTHWTSGLLDAFSEQKWLNTYYAV